MIEPGPFSPLALSAGVIANLATDVLKHAAPALAGTPAGRVLKRAGLIAPDFDDRLGDTLRKALSLYFATYPQYNLLGIAAFFGAPLVAGQLGRAILGHAPLDQAELDHAIQQHLGSYKASRVLFDQRGLDPGRIIPDFLGCYRRVVREQLSVPELALLAAILDLSAEIRASETRMQEYITQRLATSLSPERLRAAYQAGRETLAGDLAAEAEVAGLAKPDQATQTIRARLQTPPRLFAEGLCRGRPLQAAADQYFVAHGFDEATLADWRAALAESLARAGGATEALKPYFAGDTLLGGFRLCAICEKLCATRFSVFLLPPSQDRNVYLELGIALGLRAPILLIQHHAAAVPPLLEGLARYTRGGLFRTMRRELPGQVEEYDFGALRCAADLPAPGSRPAYLLAPGDVIDDDDFAGSIADALGAAYPHLVPQALTAEGVVGASGWALDQLIAAIQAARFGIYRIDEECSPASFLALGISIGLSRPFLPISRAGRAIPRDLQGIGLYQFPNFVTLRRDLISRHRAFFERYTT